MAEGGRREIDASSDSSSDEGEDVPYGYEPLPQEEGGDPASDDSGAGSSVEDEPVDDGVMADGVAKAEKTISEGESSMKSGEVSAILSLMSGFQLPSSSIPEWAKVVPEEVWKKELVSGLSEGQVPAAIDRAKKQKKKKKKRKKGRSSEEQPSSQVQGTGQSVASKQMESQQKADLPQSGSDWAAMGILTRRRKLSFGDEEELRKELNAALECDELADANVDNGQKSENS